MAYPLIDNTAYADDEATDAALLLSARAIADTSAARPMHAGWAANTLFGEQGCPFVSQRSTTWAVLRLLRIPATPGRSALTVRCTVQATLGPAASGTAGQLRLQAGRLVGTAVDVAVSATNIEVELTLDMSGARDADGVTVELQWQSARGAEHSTFSIWSLETGGLVMGSAGTYSTSPVAGAHYEMEVALTDAPETTFHVEASTDVSGIMQPADWHHSIWPVPLPPVELWPRRGDKTVTAALYYVGAVQLRAGGVTVTCAGALDAGAPDARAIGAGQRLLASDVDAVSASWQDLYTRRLLWLSCATQPGFTHSVNARVSGAETLVAGGVWHQSLDATGIRVLLLWYGPADQRSAINVTLELRSAGNTVVHTVAATAERAAGQWRVGDRDGVGCLFCRQAAVGGLSDHTSRDSGMAGDGGQAMTCYARIDLGTVTSAVAWYVRVLAGTDSGDPGVIVAGCNVLEERSV